MARRPTIADVAALAGVSRATVSFVLNDRPGVADHTRERVRAAADQLGWSPNQSARALSTGRARAVGLVLTREPELIGTDPFYPAFMAGIESVLSQTGDGLMLHVVRESEEVETYRRLAADRRVDGVFLTDLRVDDQRLALVDELALPAVAVGAGEHAAGLTAVDLDDQAVVAEAVRHLAALGHRNIACIAGPEEFRHARRRRRAWAQTLAELGLPECPFMPGGFTAEGGARATEALLALPDRPTAIVYGNDLSATAGMAVAHEAGLRIPGDLSVIGYDDVPLASWTRPALTTCRADAASWGQAAAQALMDVVEHGATPDVYLPPATLVVRGSTGPVRSGPDSAEPPAPATVPDPS